MRPGGALKTITFSTPETNSQVYDFHLLADNATATSLLGYIASNCSSVLNSNSTGSQPIVSFNATDPGRIRPEQVVYYYRASSIALTLDGYNDTVALDANATANDTHTPLPDWVNSELLDCLNETIGLGAPLVTNTTESLLNMSSMHTWDRTKNLTNTGVPLTAASASGTGAIGMISLLMLLLIRYLQDF